MRMAIRCRDDDDARRHDDNDDDDGDHRTSIRKVTAPLLAKRLEQWLREMITRDDDERNDDDN